MKIAIRGHKTRGQEVIKILESLGGKQGMFCLQGTAESYVYFIDKHIGNSISCGSAYFCSDCKIYTLEEFEKEFPFKVGDKIRDCSDNETGTILGFFDNDGELMYDVDFDNSGRAYMPSNTLELYKEMKEERNITLTLEKAKEWYKKGEELREIALQAFTEQELSPLPKSWKEYCKRYKVPTVIFGPCIANKYAALWKLEQLRDCYRQGWKPNWNNSVESKYCITIEYNTLSIRNHGFLNVFLSFQSLEITEEFIKNFEPLIKEAGDLI